MDQAVHSVLESGQFIGGPFVQQFESTFASLHGVKYCVGVGNGTDAIFIALKALGVSTGDEVITPAFGWISSAETITLAGGKPVFADILPETFTVNPERIEEKITGRTRGVILIHLYGQAAHAQELKRICEQRGLFLVEDCAQAHLTAEFGVSVGNIGDAGAFSFYPTKNLGAYGDAGCILTNDDKLEKRARLYANHGGLSDHAIEGVNSRLDTLQAALLAIKCRHLSRWTEQRIAHAGLYNELLREVDQIVLPITRQDTRHTFHQYVIRTPRRDELKNYLAMQGIQTMIHYPKALPNLPAYRYLNHAQADFPQASRCQEEVLSLPVHPELSHIHITYVCEKIKQFYKRG